MSHLITSNPYTYKYNPSTYKRQYQNVPTSTYKPISTSIKKDSRITESGMIKSNMPPQLNYYGGQNNSRNMGSSIK
jgi:hypothetical protein